MIEYYKNLSLENLFYIDKNGIIKEEEWRDILISLNGMYQVSNLGRVKSFAMGKQIIKHQQFHPKGYLLCGLYINKKHFKAKIHRLVAQAFIPNPLNLPQVNHNTKTGDKTDNRSWNLEWATDEQNRNHAKKNGLFFKGSKGESHNLSKLTEKEVLEIREIHKNNRKNYKETALKYNVSTATVGKIVVRILWKHI